MKTLLILSDGMRPDSIYEHEVVKYFKAHGTYCMNAQTVMPSVTLPCHMSLFHSVDPSRHGITSNTYVPQMRPISGLIEQLTLKGLKCGMFYNWEELRDIVRPGYLYNSIYVSGDRYGCEYASKESYNNTLEFLRKNELDFVFLYLGWPDDAGHRCGWMSDEYMRAVNEVCDMVCEIIKEFGDDYHIIYTADHGGHDRMHGHEIPEDMTIPMFFLGESFKKGKELQNLSIKDIAPTIAELLGADIPKEWEGVPINKR